jgi:hypothetical protein
MEDGKMLKVFDFPVPSFKNVNKDVPVWPSQIAVLINMNKIVKVLKVCISISQPPKYTYS